LVLSGSLSDQNWNNPMQVKLTQTVVDRELSTTSGTRWLHDTELRGFALAVGMTCRTFYASCEVRGRFVRRKVGRSDVLTAAEARSMLAVMRDGLDPRRPLGEALRATFEAYLDRHKLKASSIRQYRYAFDRLLR
jgi:hypothetical protein